MFEAVIGEIKKYGRIIIHRHTNPDGDAIGSQVGLKHIIKENFPEKEVYAVGDAAGRYAFIEDSAPDMDHREIRLFDQLVCFWKADSHLGCQFLHVHCGFLHRLFLLSLKTGKKRPSGQ